jgi:hypothetical protein
MKAIAMKPRLSPAERLARDSRALLAWIAFVVTALFLGAGYLFGVALRFW